MSKLAKLVIIAASAVILLAAALVFLLQNPAEVSDGTIALGDHEPTDILKLTISNSYGSYEVNAEGEGYTVHDIPAPLVDIEEFYTLMTNSAKITAVRSADKGSRDPSVFGLSAPEADVRIDYRDGTALTLSVGAKERVTGNYYVRVNGEKTVYLMESAACQEFLEPAKAYIEDTVTPELALSSPLSAILDVTFTGGGLDFPVKVESVSSGSEEVKRAAVSFGSATHIIRGRGTYELNQTYGIEALGALLGITAEDIADYNCTKEELSAFGFDSPYMSVDFNIKNGLDAPVVPYTLVFVKNGEGTYYMTCNENGVVYIVPELPFLKLDYKQMQLRWFLSPLIMDLDSVQVTTPSETLVFELEGKTNAEKTVTLNDEPFDIERFRAFYKLLTSASNDGEPIPEGFSGGSPLLAVEYRYLDANKEPDVLKMYVGDSRRVYAEVNGVTEFGMREMFVTRVLDACSAIRTDAPIEVNW